MNFVEILAPGFEEIEAFTPVDYLRRGNVQVTVAGISAPGKTFSKIIEGAHGIKVECDVSFEDYLKSLNGQLPDGIIIPGGMPGAANIGSNKMVLDFILQLNEKQKLICAICAAPIVVLAQTGLLAGKNFTCYPGMEKNIEQYAGFTGRVDELIQGAKLDLSASNVKDQNLITGKGPGAAEEFSMTILEAVVGTENMLKVKTSSMQR